MDAKETVLMLVFALGIWGAWGWHQDQDRARALRTAAPRSEVRTAIPAPRAVRPLPTIPADGVGLTACPAAKELIVQVANDYDVPSGMLYAHWRKESGARCGGHGNARPWYRPSDLITKDGLCVTSYGAEKCRERYKALLAICAQTRRTSAGKPVCDPDSVRTARGLEMGPMQFMPTTFFRPKGGKFIPSGVAVDYDRDGAFDPHSLADAMASAAKIIRHRYELARSEQPRLSPFQAWESAANRYNGDPTGRYYAGRPGKRGIMFFWNEWCEITGACRRAAVVSR